VIGLSLCRRRIIRSRICISLLLLLHHVQFCSQGCSILFCLIITLLISSKKRIRKRYHTSFDLKHKYTACASQHTLYCSSSASLNRFLLLPWPSWAKASFPPAYQNFKRSDEISTFVREVLIIITQWPKESKLSSYFRNNSCIFFNWDVIHRTCSIGNFPDLVHMGWNSFQYRLFGGQDLVLYRGSENRALSAAFSTFFPGADWFCSHASFFRNHSLF